MIEPLNVRLEMLLVGEMMQKRMPSNSNNAQLVPFLSQKWSEKISEHDKDSITWAVDGSTSGYLAVLWQRALAKICAHNSLCVCSGIAEVLLGIHMFDRATPSGLTAARTILSDDSGSCVSGIKSCPGDLSLPFTASYTLQMSAHAPTTWSSQLPLA